MRVGSRRYYLVVVAIVIKSQSQSQGRDRGEERSTYATPCAQRSPAVATREPPRGAGQVRRRIGGWVGELLLLTSCVTKRVWYTNCYTNLSLALALPRKSVQISTIADVRRDVYRVSRAVPFAGDKFGCNYV